MALRTTGNKHVVSISAPADVSIGDEWFDSSSNRLYKFMITTANASPTWNELYTSISGAGITFPNWASAGRPSNPTNGTIGYNTSLISLEMYVNGNWTPLPPPLLPPSFDYLVVGGGGGAGSPGGAGAPGAGGGAGGLLASFNVALTSSITYTVTVGSGGAAGVGGTRGTNGNASSITTLVNAAGGGGGGGGDAAAGIGAAGGSGGGGYYGLAGGAGNTPATTPSQGNAGGDGPVNGTNGGWAGGGGGAGAAGQQGGSGGGGAGGAGTFTSIISTTTAISLGVGQYVTSTNAVYFSGGGSSGGHTGIGNIGSLGGGGAGGGPSAAAGGGGAFTGGGGGGAGTGNINAGAGGSGMIIIRHSSNYSSATTVIGTLPTIVNTGGFWVYVFKSSATISFYKL